MAQSSRQVTPPETLNLFKAAHWTLNCALDSDAIAFRHLLPIAIADLPTFVTLVSSFEATGGDSVIRLINVIGLASHLTIDIDQRPLIAESIARNGRFAVAGPLSTADDATLFSHSRC